jgi:hypothetical protein
MFLRRSYQKEMMDNFSLDEDKVTRAHKELHIINKFLGGRSVTKTGLNYFVRPADAVTNILDVGGGTSDILYDLRDNINSINIFSMDLNLHICLDQKLKRGNNKIICADALNLPLNRNSFDIIHSSLFLHHFTEDQIIHLLKTFLPAVKMGIVINDLRRNIIAYFGIGLLTRIFSKSEYVKNDGPLSVKRAFSKKDLITIIRNAGIKYFIIKRKWAFRFLIIIPSLRNE